MIDGNLIKNDFPILSRKFHGKELVYLDSAATSQKPRSVIDSISDYYENHNANVHRGIYRLSEEGTELYEKSRKNVADFVSADAREIVYVRNTTEGLNLLAYSLGKKLSHGDTVLLTEMEHHSNMVPWQFLRDKGVRIEYVKMKEDFTLDMEDYAEKLKMRPKIVSVTQSSNVVGTINPIKEMVPMAHEVNAAFIVDGAQSVPHMPVSFSGLDCDFLVFSGHKMLGPMGIGCVVGKLEELRAMDPFLGGGDMIREVSYDRATWNDVPYKFEAGTQNVAGSIGLSAAVDYLRNLGMNNVREHEILLIRETSRRMGEIEDLEFFGPADPGIRGGVFSFNLGSVPAFKLERDLKSGNLVVSRGVHPHDVAASLDMHGIAVRSGHHCAMPLMGRMDVAATTRASYYVYNTVEDVNKLFIALNDVKREFAR